MAHVLGVLVAAGFWAAQAAPQGGEGRVKQEQEKLQGTWRAVRITTGGVQLPAGKVQDFRLIIKGDEFTTAVGKERVEGTYKLNPSQEPRQMDITLTSGPDK